MGADAVNKIERPGVESGRRRTPVQDAEIDVTVRTGYVARDTAKQIHSPDTVVGRVEKVVHTLFNVGSSHTSIIPWQLAQLAAKLMRMSEDFQANRGDRGGD
jgi:hypothetical protein